MYYLNPLQVGYWGEPECPTLGSSRCDYDRTVVCMDSKQYEINLSSSYERVRTVASTDSNNKIRWTNLSTNTPSTLEK